VVSRVDGKVRVRTAPSADGVVHLAAGTLGEFGPGRIHPGTPDPRAFSPGGGQGS
jgi:hypothetical protein